MNRWKKAAVLCALLAAMSNSSPATAGLKHGRINTQTAAINVAKHFPADMATNVAQNTPLTVEFGGSVNQSFYQTVNLNLFQGATPIEGELFYNPAARQIMFKSKTPLEEGQTYTAQLSYFDGLGRTSEKVWSFQTNGAQAPVQKVAKPQPAPTSQQVKAESYLNISNATMGSGSVEPDASLEVSFSEPLDIATLKRAPVKLFHNNKTIGVDYKLSRDMKTLTISPRNQLQTGKKYFISVDKALASSAGNNLRKKTLIPFKIAGNNQTEDFKFASHEITESPAPKPMVAQQPVRTHNFQNPFEKAAPKNVREVRQNLRAPVQTTRPVQPLQPQKPAQVIGLAPANGTKVTNLTQPITIGFDNEIRKETLNEFTFRLEDDFGPVPAKIHYFKGHKQATLTPIGVLDNNKTYRVVVTQGITDLEGKPIKTGITSMFRTTSPAAAPAMPKMFEAPKYQTAQKPVSPVKEASELESFGTEPQYQTKPMIRQSAPQPRQKIARQPRQKRRPVRQQLKTFKVTSIYPGTNASKVARNSKIAVHFSEPADPSTINSINISVFGKQRRVEGKVTYDGRKHRAIFTPNRPLDSNTDYKVIVNNKIKSKLGEKLSKRFSWQFATTRHIQRNYKPRKTAEADAAFYIPLVDSKVKMNPRKMKSQSERMSSNNGGAFNFVHPKHWAFKSMKHISKKGILNSFPFLYTDSVTRYEFASAINNGLNNLKAMQHNPVRPKLKIADMVELEKLVIEFRSELKSYAVNTSWFENFLKYQGVNLKQIELHVRKLNQ
jgi:hypothetical protein